MSFCNLFWIGEISGTNTIMLINTIRIRRLRSCLGGRMFFFLVCRNNDHSQALYSLANDRNFMGSADLTFSVLEGLVIILLIAHGKI